MRVKRVSAAEYFGRELMDDDEVVNGWLEMGFILLVTLVM